MSFGRGKSYPELALGLVIELGMAASCLRLKVSKMDSNLYFETGILRRNSSITDYEASVILYLNCSIFVCQSHIVKRMAKIPKG